MQNCAPPIQLRRARCKNATLPAKGLKTSDGAIPSPPFDLTIARAEQRPFRDSSGNLITPKRPTVYRYHFKVECIKAVEPLFVPSSVRIPDVRTNLCTAHVQHLMNTFQITVLIVQGETFFD